MTDKENTGFDNSDIQRIGALFFVVLIVAVGAVAVGPQGSTGSVNDFTYPEFAGETGLTIDNSTDEPNFRAAVDSHTQYLSNTSYTIEINGVNELGESQSSESSVEYKYNNEQQVAFSSQNINSNESESFEDFGEQERFVNGDNNYTRQPVLQPIPFTASNEFIQIMNFVNVNATSVTDGGSVVVYDITGVRDEYSQQTPFNIDGEIKLHTEGYFTGMDVEITNESQGIYTQQDVNVSNIGSTNVEEPEWVSTAREETDELTEEYYQIPTSGNETTNTTE